MLSIVIPVYNEEDVLPELIPRLLTLKDMFNEQYEYIFVDDGSSDRSLDLLLDLAKNNKLIKVLSFSRNFGHQMAVTAGLLHASGAHVAIIDADLQDPPELIPAMYKKLIDNDLDVVYGKRKHRAGETVFKKVSASMFYKVLNYMCDLDIPKDTGDFRIISRKVVEAFRNLPERHRFVRGMIPWLGFKSAPYEYDRQSRNYGETKYPLAKMIKFSANAIFSFSNKPLVFATKVGILFILFSIIFGSYTLYLKLFTDIVIPGFTSTLLLIMLSGGIQIFIMGCWVNILGGYLKK